MPPLARLVSLSILTIVMVFLGVTFFQVIAPFLLPLFLAGIVAVTCQPVFRYFLKITKQRPRVSAGLTTLTVLATILIPLLFGTFTASVQMYALRAMPWGAMNGGAPSRRFATNCRSTIWPAG